MEDLMFLDTDAAIFHLIVFPLSLCLIYFDNLLFVFIADNSF